MSKGLFTDMDEIYLINRHLTGMAKKFCPRESFSNHRLTQYPLQSLCHASASNQPTGRPKAADHVGPLSVDERVAG
jgi:hypothetical protein